MIMRCPVLERRAFESLISEWIEKDDFETITHLRFGAQWVCHCAVIKAFVLCEAQN